MHQNEIVTFFKDHAWEGYSYATFAVLTRGNLSIRIEEDIIRLKDTNVLGSDREPIERTFLPEQYKKVQQYGLH